MASQQPPTPTGNEAAVFEESMKNLKMAAIFMIVAAVLTGVGTLASVTASLNNFQGPPASAVSRVFTGVVIAAMIGGIVILVATFLYLFKAFSRLEEFNPEKFGGPATIVKIGFPAYGAMVIITPIMMYIAVLQLTSQGMPDFATVQQVMGILQIISAFAFIAKAVAMLGIGIGMYYAYEVSNEGFFLAAAILFFIAIFIPLLSFIAWILVIIGAGNATNKIKASHAAQQSQMMSPTSNSSNSGQPNQAS